METKIDDKILAMVASEILRNDSDGEFRQIISTLSPKYHKLNRLVSGLKMAHANGTVKIDKNVSKAIETVLAAAIEADNLKRSSIGGMKKEADKFLSKLIIKTLKIAQKTLAMLLVLSPMKIGVAYNAMQSAIKFLEKELLKK